MITYDDFTKIDIRAGKVVDVQDFDRARRPTYKVVVDFGAEIGRKWSSLQAKADYPKDQLLGKIRVGVVNLPPKNIAGFMSEVLILGVPAEDGSLSLLSPTRGAILGGKAY